MTALSELAKLIEVSARLVRWHILAIPILISIILAIVEYITSFVVSNTILKPSLTSNLISLFLLMALRTTLAILSSYVIVRFAMLFQRELRLFIYKKIMDLPNEAEVAKEKAIFDTVTASSAVANGVIVPTIKLVADLIIVVLLFILSTFLIPVEFYLIIFAALPILLGFQLIAKKAAYLGQIGNAITEKINFWILSSIDGRNDKRYFGLGYYLVQMFDAENLAYSRINTLTQTLINSIKPLFEMYAFIVVIALVIFGFSSNDVPITAYGVIGFLMLRSVSLAPSFLTVMARIANNKNNISRCLEYFVQDQEIMPKKEKIYQLKMNENELVISKDDQRRRVFCSGNMIWISGPSGSGKSIMLNQFVSELNSDSVSIAISGEGLIVKDGLKYNITLKKSISELDETRLGELIRALDLDGVSRRSEIDRLELSKGEADRVILARALFKDCQIYVFDEIFSNLPELMSKEIILYIMKNYTDKTFVIASHQKYEVGTIVSVETIGELCIDVRSI